MRRFVPPVMIICVAAFAWLIIYNSQAGRPQAAATAFPTPVVTPLAGATPTAALAADSACGGRICPDPTRTPTISPTPVDPANLPTVAGDAQPFVVAGDWRLVLNEEFNGSALNTRIWQPNWFGHSLTSVTQYINSEEGQCFDPAQLKVGDGELAISAIEKVCPDTAGESAGLGVTSGMINSYPRFTFTYGVAEARIWVNGPDETHCNNWVSFWLNGMPVDGRQEYDVAECLEGSLNFHLNPQNVYGGSNSGPISGGWHVFSIDWEPSGATVWYDQAQVGTITDNVYTEPMYIIVENAVRDNPSTVLPDTMRIDYIRVWQGTPQAADMTSVPGNAP